MCGIAGAIALDGRPIQPGAIVRSLDALAHRGPNGHGVSVDGPVALAHRRLSILDPTDAGAQPMTREGVTLIHNGEVYNFLEIRAELERLGTRLTSQSDTEVVIEAYRTWGLDAFPRFNGMWAMTLWDAPRRRLVLSRDRLGVKPLYVRRTGRTLAWASEPAALAAATPLDAGDTWRPEPFGPAVRDFLQRALVDHADHTFYAGIEQVPAGHHVIVEDGNVTRLRYWSAPPLSDDDAPDAAPDDDRLVDEFAELFGDSVRLRLRSDVPLGSCLSGGLDSSAIVQTVADHLAELGGRAGAREQMPRFAFHARFPQHGVDESHFAEVVAERARVELVMAREPGPLISAASEVLAFQGEPYASTSTIAQFEVMRAAASKVTVLLDGQGADELFGGYPRYLGYRAAALARRDLRHLPGELRRIVRHGTIGAGGAVFGLLRGLAGDRLRERIRAASGRFGIRLGPALRTTPTAHAMHDEPGTLLARRLWQDISREGLPALLRYEDRTSMAFAVEARVPFLDYRIVELACRLPDRLRVGGGETKVILRRAMRERLPEAIVDRRDKMGFVTPQSAWTSGSRDEVAAIVRDGAIVDRGWVTAAEVERLLRAASAQGSVNEQLWRLLITELWLKRLEGGAAAPAA